MQISYMTHDEVNAAVAKRFARRLGLNLTVLAINDADQAIAADHLVHDLDHLPEECKSKLFYRSGGGFRSGVTVHSYNLRSTEKMMMRAAGVRIARRLVVATLICHSAVAVVPQLD